MPRKDQQVSHHGTAGAPGCFGVEHERVGGGTALQSAGSSAIYLYQGDTCLLSSGRWSLAAPGRMKKCKASQQ
jgi:hypothetical protein